MDYLVLFEAILFGFIIGIITGMVPGIHVNTVAALMVSVSTFLFGLGWDATIISVFIVSVAITHAFFDYIPSLFIGVPTDEVFALLPGHRMVKQGRGLEALDLSIKGSLNGIIIGVIVLLVFLGLNILGIKPLSILDKEIRPYLFIILSVISFLLIITEKRKLWSLFVFICSGLFGMVVFSSPLVPSDVAPFSSLFPALTGIFGLSGLILALFEKTGSIPEQKRIIKPGLSKGEILTSSSRGTFAGIMVGLLPGLGGANAATLLLLIERFLGRHKDKTTSGLTYIVTTSAINTADAMFGIAALYFIGKSRSGASVAIGGLFSGELTTLAFMKILLGMIIAAFLSTVIMRKFSMSFAKVFSKLNYLALNMAVIIFVTLLVIFTTGIWGFVVMVGGALLGMIPVFTNVRRAQTMGFFLIPVLLFYSGKEREIVSALHLEAKIQIPNEISIQNIGLDLSISAFMAITLYFLTKIIVRYIKK